MYPRTVASGFSKPSSQWFPHCFRTIHTQSGPFRFSIMKEVSEISHFDNILVNIDTFNFAYRLHCMDYWNGLFFPDLIYEKWIYLVTVLLILSFTLLFIVISIITIVIILFLLSLVLPISLLFIICYLFLS